MRSWSGGSLLKINGFQKMTLLDFPGKVACTVFTGGCNFRCPFCHNSRLVNNTAQLIDEAEVLAFLEKRRGLLDGVCITGGEPLLQSDIGSFMLKLKQMGYAVKLDTNGSFPDRLKKLVSEGIVDYVAMDVKNSPEKYALTAGNDNVSVESVKESIEFLLTDAVDYEFRTTVVKNFHRIEDIREAARSISGAKRYFLQYFVDSGEVLESGLEPVSKEIMEKMRDEAAVFVASAEIRGG